LNKHFLFTQERLSKLSPPSSGRVEYFDTKQQKLRLRITSTGTISFAVVKKLFDKPKRVTIGTWPEISIAKAREQAIKILDDIRQGVDPVAMKRKKVLATTTLNDVMEQYLLERDLKPYTVNNYRYKLKLGFSDWLDMSISKIDEDMLLKRHKQLTLKGKTTANTTMRVMRLTLNYAVAIGMIEKNPTSILSKARLWHKNKRKNRTIPSDKLMAWHEAVDALINQQAKVYLLILLYMGFRSSEALTLEWSNVDLKRKLITLSDTKNRTDHTLPIPDFLTDYLTNLYKQNADNNWVFPSINGPNPMSIPIKPIKKVIEASGVDFSPHDCRRTFATIAEAIGLPMSMIKRLMNHVTTNDVTGGYIVTEEETLRTVINKIADYIQAKVTTK
jgi:integrase|tara:strand:- start:16335 stop:17498 length:1164 start_codon:yes stop_codon:yes gene_type:complete